MSGQCLSFRDGGVERGDLAAAAGGGEKYGLPSQCKLVLYRETLGV